MSSSSPVSSIFELAPISHGAKFISGYAFKSSDFTDSGIPVIKIKNIQSGVVTVGGSQCVPTSLITEKIKKFETKSGDVLIAMTGQGSVGRVGRVICKKEQRLMLNQRVGRFVADEKTLNLDYLYYVISSEPYEQFLFDRGAGSGQPNLSPENIMSVEIPFPDYKQQVEISTLLNSLDNRIALLRETNATLEAIAHALFKSWFVDFDPVHANAGTQSPSLPPEIQALFPATFTDSPQGPIPDGWELGTMEDLFVLQRGFDLPSSSRVEGQYPLIAASGPNGTHAKAMVKGPGVVTGRSGVLGKVFFTLEDFWPLNTTLWIKEFKRATPCYAFEVLKRLDTQSFNAGSAVPSLNRNHIHGLPYILPPKALVDHYEGIALTAQQKIHENNKQVDSLIAIRDSLLPRLISGRMRLPEAEQAIAAITH